jgi:acetylornithine deacetylase
MAASETSQVEALLADMVRIPSVNPRDGEAPAEREMGEYVAAWLRQAGLEAVSEPVLPGRSNVVARLRGKDSTRALFLETHMDTVEVEEMSIPPFEPDVREGRLYGRGSCDAKGCLAAFMTALADVAKSGTPPEHDVVLAAVVDEEHRFRGVLHLLESGRRFAAAVVGEPTQLRLVTAHKGCVRFRVRARGRSAHSSQPWDGDNAIARMAPVITFVQERLAAQLASTDHPLVGPPTISPTMIEGGMGINVVPPECTLFIDRRTVPGEDPMAVWRDYKRAIEQLGPGSIEVLPPEVTDVALDTPPTSDVVASMARVLTSHQLDPEPIGVNYGSDASKIGERGVPSIVFGPGSIRDAHQPDESVDLAEVVTASRIVRDLIRDFPRR